jgi:ketosteroid isomerase-like protein
MDRDSWIRDLFRCVDAKDSDGWIEFLAPDARFRFGNAAVVEGRTAIHEAITAFFASISELRHDLVDVWHHPDTVICRGEVIYTRLDGSTLSIPFVNVLKLDGGLIRDYLVYVDASELHSPLVH